MTLKRYEVRARICSTGEDGDEVQKFFFRKSAENFCWRMNSMRLILGHFRFTYYIHDTKGDNK